jgi:hypothetical protein
MALRLRIDHHNVAIVLVAISMFMTLCLLMSCSERRGPSVQIIVPEGFKGLIKIEKDQAGQEIELKDGQYVYRIPTNGVLKVKLARGFAEWHYTVACHTNGRELPVYPERGIGGISLFEIGSSSSGKEFLFVGTEQEKEEAMKDSFHLLQ